MRFPNHVNPDHFLNLAEALSVTHEDVGNAWELSYAELREKLAVLGHQAVLYVVCGIQGSGKTTWVTNNASRFGATAVFLDGPLPSRQSRERALQVAREVGCSAVAVWINAPLELALSQNSLRPGLARIKESTVRRCYEQLEPPATTERFAKVIEVAPQRSAA